MKKIKVLVLILFTTALFMTGVTVEANSELTFPIHVIQKNAPDNESNVIVFFGDGFTEDEQGKFIEVVRKKAKVLMEMEPLKMSKESFNIYAMQVVSKESGSSVDVGANPPTPYKNTYFNIRFNYAGMYRLTNFFDGGGKRAQALYSEIEKNYLDVGGKIFHATVIINSNEYGGSGGAISITSLDSGTNTMVLHEAAHSFAGLRDEYWTGVGEGPNKTKNNDLTTIRWKEFVGFRGVGAFAYGKTGDQATWFKPVAWGCLMETLYTNSFCQVCRHEVFNKINLPRIKVFKELYIAEPIFTTETTNQEVVSGLTLKDNNVDLKTVIHNYTSNEKVLKVQIIIKDGDNVVDIIEEEKTIPANTLKSVQSEILAIPTANENYKLEVNIFDKQKNELLSTNTDGLKKAEVSYNSYLGNGTHHTTTQLLDVDKYSNYSLIGKKINPVGSEIQGYTYRGSNVPLDGVLVNETNNSINYYYTKNEGILHLVFKDENGIVSGTQDKKIAYGETFIPQQSDVPEIENYDTIFSNAVTYNGIEDVTVTYEYTKQTKEVWVEAVDKSTGAKIGKISIGKKKIGEKFTLKAPTVSEIFELALYELGDVQEKEIQLLENKEEETIVFEYNKQTKEVWVEAVDKSTGEKIGKISIGNKRIGEKITIKAPTINEISKLSLYELDDFAEKQIQLLDNKNDETITFEYTKQTKEVWVEAVDKSTGEKIGKISIGKKNIGEKITIKAPTIKQIPGLSLYEIDDSIEKQIELLDNKNDVIITFSYTKKKVENPKPTTPDIVPATPDKPKLPTNSKVETENEQVTRDVVLTNAKFNISLISKNTIITEDLELIVKKHNENSLVNNKKLGDMFTKYIAYDLELKKGEELINLKEKVTVKIPIPEGYKEEKIKLYYINDNGDKVEVISYLEKDSISFETNYLTTFIISEEESTKQEEEKIPNSTEDNKQEKVEEQKFNIYPIFIVIGVLCIIIISIIIINRNKK